MAKRKSKNNSKKKGGYRADDDEANLLPSSMSSPLSKYHPNMIPKIQRYAKIGLNEEDIAYLLHIRPATLSEWKKRLPEIAEAIKNGQSTGKRSIMHKYFKAITKDKILNPALIIFWLKNKYPTEWKDRHDIDGQIKTDTKLTIEVVRGIEPLPAIDALGENAPDLTKERLLTAGQGDDKGEGEKTPQIANTRDPGAGLEEGKAADGNGQKRGEEGGRGNAGKLSNNLTFLGEIDERS